MHNISNSGTITTVPTYLYLPHEIFFWFEISNKFAHILDIIGIRLIVLLWLIVCFEDVQCFNVRKTDKASLNIPFAIPHSSTSLKLSPRAEWLPPFPPPLPLPPLPPPPPHLPLPLPLPFSTTSMCSGATSKRCWAMITSFRLWSNTLTYTHKLLSQIESFVALRVLPYKTWPSIEQI